jgi:DUF1680 family protein
MKTLSGSSPVELTAVTFEDAFWTPRLQTVREQTLPFIYEQFRLNEYFTGFQESWKPGMSPIPYLFWESDISKWIEAASYSLATHPDRELEALVDEAIAFLVSLQQPDGYLNLWFTKVEPEKRWTNLRDYHELYCAGHLIEAAVAHYEATGKRSLLDAACRYADYIDSCFGVEEGKRRGYCGHEEIELALMKLYRTIGERRYLHLCQYFIEERGRQPHYYDSEARARGDDPANFWARTYEYNQSHLPVREQSEVVGHAVRAMYLYCAMTDLAKELDDPSLLQTCERLWQHLNFKRLYITGALGSSEANEGLTADYDLPNAAAYAETCASIGLILWNHRLLQVETDGRYADVLERTLYNGLLSGLALDGKGFFYVNPLESQGTHHRQEWFRCACCPPNIARLLTSLGEYVYSVNETDVMVHLYAQSTSKVTVGQQKITLKQETNYPWDGRVHLSMEMEQTATFALNLRIPGWCKEAHLMVNGEDLPIEGNLHKGYVRIERRWQSGDDVALDLSMPVERVYAHPDLSEDNDRVALQRGPIIYCLEEVDNKVPLHRIRLSTDAKLESHFEPALLGGVVVAQADAQALETADWEDTLYRTTPPTYHAHRLVAIPYYAWDQREPGEMNVWIRTGAS